jgi:multidrug efflux system outer membrane protein
MAVVKSRAKGGIASDLDVSQAEGARADAAVQLRELHRQRALVEHQLGNLTGKLDLKIPAGDLMRLPMPVLPPAGLPSTLLQRRPDVQQAEQNLISANAQIGAARAAQFPTFTLTGSYGGQSEALVDLTKDAARIWSFGPSMTLPIFDAGRHAARTRQAQARQRQALASYQKTVEAAFREVADALNNVQQSSATVADVQSKTDAAHTALRLARLRYEAGYSAYIEVLDAQRSANAAEQALVQNRQAQLSYSVDLMKALGGGWAPAGMTSH